MSCPLRAHRLCSQLRCSSRGLPTIARPWALKTASNSQWASPVLSHTNSYATQRAPRAPRAPAARPSNPELFDISDVTVQDFETIVNAPGRTFDSLSPEGYHKVAMMFQGAIIKGGSPDNVKLPKEDEVPPHILHEVGCIITAMPKNRSQFCLMLWLAASNRGYSSSTVSLAQGLLRSGAWGKLPRFKIIETRFRQLVQEGKDRDALAVEGERLYGLGMYDATAKMLQRALAGGSDFEMRSRCEAFLGMSLLKLGKVAEAEGLIDKSGFGEAFAELGQVLRGSDPDKAKLYLYRAGLAGQLTGFQQLSEMEFAEEVAATNGEEKKEHNRWAMEWARLADEREKI